MKKNIFFLLLATGFCTFNATAMNKESEESKTVKRLSAEEQKALNIALFSKIKVGDLEGVKNALDEGVNLRFVHKDTDTPLMYATRRGFTSIVDELIKQGAQTSSIPLITVGSRIRYIKLREIAEGYGHSDLVEYYKSNGIE
jgi:hypothetical protein